MRHNEPQSDGHDHTHGHGHADTQAEHHDHAHADAQDHDHERESGHDHGHEHGHAHGHAHSHALTPEGINARMGVAVALNVVFVVVEGCFGVLSNSVALIADAGHNLGDVLGLICSWAAIVLSRRPPGGRFTYGLGRSSVLAALTNAVLLLVACGAIAWEAVLRLAAPPTVAGLTVMAVAAVGILLNGVCAWLLHSGSHDDLNRRSAFIHMLGDAAISAGVLIAGGIIAVTGWSWLDPAVSLVIVAVILASTWNLLRDSVQLSLDAVPSGVNSKAVMSFLEGQRGVTEVHDLHIWALSTTSVALTAHLVVPDGSIDADLLGSLTPFLKQRFRIDHATLQIERDRCQHGCEA